MLQNIFRSALRPLGLGAFLLPLNHFDVLSVTSFRLCMAVHRYLKAGPDPLPSRKVAITSLNSSRVCLSKSNPAALTESLPPSEDTESFRDPTFRVTKIFFGLDGFTCLLGCASDNLETSCSSIETAGNQVRSRQSSSYESGKR